MVQDVPKFLMLINTTLLHVNQINLKISLRCICGTIAEAENKNISLVMLCSVLRQMLIQGKGSYIKAEEEVLD